MEELSPNLLFILGLLAMVIVWILREVFIRRGREVPQYVYNIVLGVVALGLAVAFAPIALPEFPSHDGSLLGLLAALLAFVGGLLPLLVSIVGFAKIIYEDLLERILKGLGDAIRRGLADIG